MLAGCVGLVFKVIRPFQEVASNEQELAVTQLQISQLDAQNDQLRQHIAYLKTSEGRITEARKLGYTKQNEIPIVVEGTPSIWSDPPLVNSTVTPGWRAKLSGFWQSLRGR